MPVDTKLAIGSLALSFVSMLIADFMQGDYETGATLGNSIGAGMSIIWGAVVAWIIFDICRKRDVSLSLYAVAAVQAFFLITSVQGDGVHAAHAFYLIEIVLFLLPLYFLKTRAAKSWIDAGQ